MIAYLFLTLLSFNVFAESRQKIVVIDTGVNFQLSTKPYMCEDGKLSTNDEWRDDHGHGSNIIGIIGDKIDSKKTCIVSIRIKMFNNKNLDRDIVKSMEMALDLKPVAINLSLAGKGKFDPELAYITKALSSGVKVVVAAGNEGMSLNNNCIIYPACYLIDIKKSRNTNANNFIVVGAEDTKSSNTGSVVAVFEIGKNQGYPKMTGTSQATANYTGSLFSK